MLWPCTPPTFEIYVPNVPTTYQVSNTSKAKATLSSQALTQYVQPQSPHLVVTLQLTTRNIAAAQKPACYLTQAGNSRSWESVQKVNKYANST